MFDTVWMEGNFMFWYKNDMNNITEVCSLLLKGNVYFHARGPFIYIVYAYCIMFSNLSIFTLQQLYLVLCMYCMLCREIHWKRATLIRTSQWLLDQCPHCNIFGTLFVHFNILLDTETQSAPPQVWVKYKWDTRDADVQSDQVVWSSH